MKSNTKKRLIAFMLCMVLVLSSATSAFADEPQNTDSQSQTEAVAEPAADEATGDEAAVNSSEQQQQEEQQPEQQQQEEQQPEQQQPETEAPTVEAPAEQPAAEEAQPIQQLTYEDDNVKITVDAVESGNIPEGATLSVTPVIKQEITDSMSDEEKAKAEELNDQYDHTEKKLNEKAENETYDIAGFLAYDITFVDADGNKMEPNGNVKISMDYKKTEIPEEAKKALEEKNDEQNLDVTVMHLEEDEQGEVKEVVDMVADETKEATVETTETKEVEKAAFVTNSFSTFTITWKKDSATYFKLTLHHVDEKGNELPTTLSSDATLNYNSDISFSDYVEIIDNYDYKYAKVDKISGKTVTSAVTNGSSGKRAKLTLYNGKDNKIETLSYSTTTKNIYLVYTAKSTGSTGSGTIEDTLEGAVFALHRVVNGTDMVVATATTDDNGIATFNGLDAQDTTYYIVETQAPSGYKIDGIEHHLSGATANEPTTNTVKDSATKITTITTTYSFTDFGESGITTITNTKLSALPSTGGIGTTIFTIAGCVIMIAAAGLFFASRKKSDNK